MARYELVPEASRLHILARSSVHPIHVEATGVTGAFDAEVVADEVVIRAGARLEVEVSELRSGNPLVDREARRRLDPRSHPRLTAELTDARSAGHGALACRGEVTFHGRTVPVEGDLAVSLLGGEQVALEGEQHVDVRRWGIEPPRLLVLKVDPELLVRLQLRGTLRPS